MAAPLVVKLLQEIGKQIMAFPFTIRRLHFGNTAFCVLASSTLWETSQTSRELRTVVK